MSKADELKKEAEEYTEENGFGSDCNNLTSYDANCEIEQAYLAGAESREKRIAELEKENAELKGIKDVATLIKANNDTVVTLMQLNNKLVSKSQQLTKAKVHIKKLIEAIHIWNYKNLEQVEAEAEQFLKEIEK